MSQLLDDDDGLPRRGNERELTLSTGAILGIFFGLALICALFFGFGYNMGRRSPQPVAAASDYAENTSPAGTSYNLSKPPAGSTSQPAADLTSPAKSAPAAPIVGPPAGAPTPSANTTQPSTRTVTVTTETHSEISTPPAAPRTTTPPPPSSFNVAGPASPGTFVVQVAAVSHPEDAELLVSALKRKGYSVKVRNESGDKLVHIQVGPFNDHHDADAMRQRLLGDGYNALIKQL